MVYLGYLVVKMEHFEEIFIFFCLKILGKHFKSVYLPTWNFSLNENS